jgi:hypothetical protein
VVQEMVDKKHIVLQKIKQLVVDCGYELYYSWCEHPVKVTPWVHEVRLHLWAKPKDGRNKSLMFDVAIGSDYLRVSFEDSDTGDCGIKRYKGKDDLAKALEFIKERLV